MSKDKGETSVLDFILMDGCVIKVTSCMKQHQQQRGAGRRRNVPLPNNSKTILLVAALFAAALFSQSASALPTKNLRRSAPEGGELLLGNNAAAEEAEAAVEENKETLLSGNVNAEAELVLSRPAAAAATGAKTNGGASKAYFQRREKALHDSWNGANGHHITSLQKLALKVEELAAEEPQEQLKNEALKEDPSTIRVAEVVDPVEDLTPPTPTTTPFPLSADTNNEVEPEQVMEIRREEGGHSERLVALLKARTGFRRDRKGNEKVAAEVEEKKVAAELAAAATTTEVKAAAEATTPATPTVAPRRRRKRQVHRNYPYPTADYTPYPPHTALLPDPVPAPAPPTEASPPAPAEPAEPATPTVEDSVKKAREEYRQTRFEGSFYAKALALSGAGKKPLSEGSSYSG